MSVNSHRALLRQAREENDWRAVVDASLAVSHADRGLYELAASHAGLAQDRLDDVAVVREFKKLLDGAEERALVWLAMEYM